MNKTRTSTDDVENEGNDVKVFHPDSHIGDEDIVTGEHFVEGPSEPGRCAYARRVRTAGL